MKEFKFQSTLNNDLTLEQIKDMLESGKCKIVPSERWYSNIVLTLKYDDDLDIFDDYDFLSKNKDLKKWETETGISHTKMNMPFDKATIGGTSMSNELIFSIMCAANETVTDVKRKLANISYVLNDAVTFDVVHIHNERVLDGVSTVVDVRMTYPTSRINDIDSKKDDLEDIVGKKDVFADILCKQIQKLTDRLTAVENESAEHRENIEELDSQRVFDYADTIDDINTRLNNLVKNVDTMRVNSYRDYKALQDVKETVTNLSDRIERLEEDNRELHSNGAFGLDFEGLNQRANACKNALTDILKDIDDLQKEKPCDKSSARSYDLELISKKVMDIDKLDENLAELKKDFNFLRNKGYDTYTGLSDLKNTVGALKNNVDNDYGALTKLKDSVQELGTDVSGARARMEGISSRIDILEKDVEDIKNSPNNYKSVTVNIFDGETDTDV